MSLICYIKEQDRVFSYSFLLKGCVMRNLLCKSALGIFLIWVVCLFPIFGHTENHALLIGIGKYKNRTLEGPPHDVAALRGVLASHYAFKTENIRTLIDGQAVKRRILAEIGQLTRRSRPGDCIFIYFSGHGTSRRDELLALPLPHGSGALVPADFDDNSGHSIEALMSQLIVGRRDLRPMLERLDRDRQVLMVFDTCFSGNSVRAAGDPQPAGLRRNIALAPKRVFPEEQYIGSFEENLSLDAPYPYQNIFYISASSENEIAKDIQQDLLYLYPTIDGKPHGALTDSLLRVLAGQVQVDTNNDGQWSQIELYEALKSNVQRRFRQTPQALPKEGKSAIALHSRPFFVRSAGSITPAAHEFQGSNPDLRIRVAADLAIVKARVSRIDGVRIVRDDPDLLITRDRDDIVLALPNGHPLCRFTAFESVQMIDRIRRHLRIQPIINLAYPRQQFNVGVDLRGPYQKRIIHEDEIFGFEIYTEKSAYVLLIDVDPAGVVHVLYPFDPSELQPLVAGERKEPNASYRALWPFGTETLKLFAFTHRPAELEILMGKENIHPDSPLFETLERLVGIDTAKFGPASPRRDAAQAVLKITSYARADMSVK